MDEIERESVAFEKSTIGARHLFRALAETVDSEDRATFKGGYIKSRPHRYSAKRHFKQPADGACDHRGVTDSIPATVALMRAVASLPQGAIVLPRSTVRSMMKLERIVPDHRASAVWFEKAARSAASPVPTCISAVRPAAGKSRAMPSSASNAPGKTTRSGTYAASTARDDHAGADRRIVDQAPSAREAEVVALILREAVETPGRTAALVSPDRLLARRVAIRLEAWGIRVDDSAGRPFAKTVPGTFLNLVIGAAVSDFAPAGVMALLKHPLCRLGLKAFDVRRFGRA
jgi:ATP-dependent helicase/nuclease subunit B